jgi:hypothetical protein
MSEICLLHLAINIILALIAGFLITVVVLFNGFRLFPSLVMELGIPTIVLCGHYIGMLPLYILCPYWRGFIVLYALPIPLLVALGLTILAMPRSAIASLGVELVTNADMAEIFSRDHGCEMWRGPSGCRVVVERFYRSFGVTAGVVCLALAVILMFLVEWLRVASSPRQRSRLRLLSLSMSEPCSDSSPPE